MSNIGLYIARNDLRIHDNEALLHACQHDETVIAFIYEEKQFGGAQKWWLHHALIDFSTSIEQLGSRLIIRKGDFEQELRQLLTETNATTVHWSREYAPEVYTRDRDLSTRLAGEDITIRTYEGKLLLPPWKIQKQASHEGYKVFTPFFNQFMKEVVPAPVPKPVKVPAFTNPLSSLTVDDLQLLPTIPWDAQFIVHKPSEKEALKLFRRFLEKELADYAVNRDFPYKSGTSRLSPYLAFGQISPRVMWATLMDHVNEQQALPYLRQLVWREFSYHLLFQLPMSVTDPMNNKFQHFSWEENDEWFRTWHKGKTGFPIVDAGMRELWQTGTLHNRVRMIVASFLTKHLLIPWQHGATWFMDTLVDADIANNTFGWQWVAGTGVDAAPYFRIFNPSLQGKKFDPMGEYVKQWVPELKELPAKYIHEPWTAPTSVLDNAGIILGITYPKPIVDHKQARLRALDKYNEIK